jgi:hypothetical protein
MKRQHRKAPSQRPYTDHHPLDGMATWSSESLLRMDEQFVVAVEVAFRRGLEDPDAAARTYNLRGGRLDLFQAGTCTRATPLRPKASQRECQAGSLMSLTLAERETWGRKGSNASMAHSRIER